MRFAVAWHAVLPETQKFMFGDTEQKLTPLTKVAVFPPLRLPPMIALIRIPEVLAVRAGGSDLHTNTLPRRVEVVPFSSEGGAPSGRSLFGFRALVRRS
jgi:hypothetical protein